MTNPEINNNDLVELEVFDPVYQQDMVDFGTAETRPVGEILARKLLSDTVTATADTGNTGDGVVANQGLYSNGSPAKVGSYNLECVEKITNSGRFKLVDPDGKELTDQIVVAVSGTTVFEGFGLTFDISDGSTDFEVGDKFAIVTTADGALDTYDPAGIDGTNTPVALMARARTEATAADYPEGVLVKGEVRRDIVETAYGASVDKPLTDKLASIGIILRNQDQMAVLDNS